MTGHGIAAATLVAAVKFISGGFYRGARSAAQVMERTNHVLVKETPSEIMIPMVYGWLYPADPGSQRGERGARAVLLRRADGRIEEILPTGLVLGLMETRYTGAARRLRAAATCCFPAPTASPPRPPAQSLGVERVKELVAAHAAQPAAVLVQRVLEAALNFYGTPKDDMSLIVLKRTE